LRETLLEIDYRARMSRRIGAAASLPPGVAYALRSNRSPVARAAAVAHNALAYSGAQPRIGEAVVVTPTVVSPFEQQQQQAGAASPQCSFACIFVSLVLLLLTGGLLTVFFVQNTRIVSLEHHISVLQRQHMTEVAYSAAAAGTIGATQSRNALAARYSPPPPPPALQTQAALPQQQQQDKLPSPAPRTPVYNNANTSSSTDDFERLLNAGRSALRDSRGMTRLADNALMPTSGTSSTGAATAGALYASSGSGVDASTAPAATDTGETHDHYRFTIERPEDESKAVSGIRIPPGTGSIERFDTKRLLTCHVCCRPEVDVFVCPPADQLSLLVRYSPTSDEHYVRLMVHNRAYYGADCVLYWVLDNDEKQQQ
jgi:hypothetical protein